MKKIYTFMAAAVMALTANAKDYVDQLAITLNGSEPITSEATISVNAPLSPEYRRRQGYPLRRRPPGPDR